VPGLVLLLLPGLDGTGDLFRPLLDALPTGTRTRVVAYPRDERLGYAELLPLVTAAAAEAGPHVVVAESFSGPLAVAYAATRPRELRGVVLCATFMRNPLPVPVRWLRLFARTTVCRMRPPRCVVRVLLTGGDAPAELIGHVIRSVESVQPAVLAHRLREVLDRDTTHLLDEVRVPVLHVGGSRDRLLGTRGLAQIAARLPGLRTVVLDAPHLVLQRRPAETAHAIVAFAAAVTAAPSAPAP
jgi:pimeloyl-[acyl-carrier protein] methyl ester esterase